MLFTGPLPGPADIQVVDISRVGEAREAIPLVTSEFNETNARFSPDGRWFAYASNESGTYEIYVRPFNPDAAPGTPLSVGGRVMVSKGGATRAARSGEPTARSSSTSRRTGSLMSVAVETEPTFQVIGSPQALFKAPSSMLLFFDVSRDGQRFFDAGSGRRRRERAAVQSRVELDVDAEVTTPARLRSRRADRR